MSEDKTVQIDQILQSLPHRYPFVLIDRILTYEPGTTITGVKNITFNEWYFEGLAPVLRIVPALILCEAVAQLGAMLVFMEEEGRGKLIYFTGIDRVRFRKPIRPGDTLILTASIIRRKGRVGKFRVEGKVDDRVVFNGAMRFAIE
jgi:3-hydroxyacyl-[acyl-carrier-protein] dehydratase